MFLDHLHSESLTVIDITVDEAIMNIENKVVHCFANFKHVT